MSNVRYAVGCMSGTSCDGVDAAVIRAEGTGVSLRARPIGVGGAPLGETGRSLKRFSLGEPLTPGAIARSLEKLTDAHAAAIGNALRDAQDALRDAPIELIACHGQTLHHASGVSWQAFNAAPIARRFGVPVVHDLRAADIAAGGEGAPITPLADAALFPEPRPLTVVNLGGFCNITVLHADGSINGRDVCPCNHLLDGAAAVLLGEPYDDRGSHASRGTPDRSRAVDIARGLFAASDTGRSLGSGDEHLAALDTLNGLAPEDALATLCDAIGRTIARTVRSTPSAILAGGGALNRALTESIARHANATTVELASSHGIPVNAREAAAMAVLGLRCADGLPITLPAVTRVPAPAPVSGCWTLPPDGAWCVVRSTETDR